MDSKIQRGSRELPMGKTAARNRLRSQNRSRKQVTIWMETVWWTEQQEKHLQEPGLF